MAEGAGEKVVEKKEPEQRWHRSPNYREIAPSWLSCNINYGLFELIAVISKTNLSESVPINNTVIEHIEELCMRITPQTAKFLLVFLLENLKQYESTIGHIKSGNDAVDSKVDEILAKF